MRRRRTDWEAVSRKLAFAVLSGVAIVFLVAPSLVVILTSLTSSASLKFPPDGLSLRWYRELIDADQMQRAAWNSLIVAIWTMLISVVLGTAASLALARSRSAFARGLDLLFMSPLLLPALAFGFAALTTFIFWGSGRTSRSWCSDMSSFASRSSCAPPPPRSPRLIPACSMPPTASAPAGG